MAQKPYREFLSQTPKNLFYQVNIKFILYNFRLKLRLSKLFSKGMDFWKLPLSSNAEFLEDVQNLIQAELIADNLMRDLINKE